MGGTHYRFGLIGPTWPFRGGIAHHTSLLARALANRHELRFMSFSRMYPSWLYPGASDRETGDSRLRTGLDEPLLDSMNPATWFLVGRRMSVWKPDAVIMPWWVVFWAPQFFMIAQLLRRARVPVVFLCHNVREHENSAWRSLLTWQVLRTGDAFLCHSDEELEILRKWLPGRVIRRVVHPSYKYISGLSDSLEPAPENKKELLFFGFIRNYKGLDVLLEAMPEVNRATGACLHVAGEAWVDQAFWHRQVKDLGLGKVVQLDLRYIPNEEIPSLFARAALVLLPYRTATGCGPLQLAFGAGKPVVGSAVGGIAESVQNGKNGLLVPPGDPVALASAIIRALEPECLASLTRGAEQAATAFSWDILVDAIEEVTDALERKR